MSNIPFLDSAHHGKNSWWRYLITIILTLAVAPVVAGAIIGFLLALVIMFFSQNMDVSILLYQLSSTDALMNSPLLFLVLVAIAYALAFFFLYLALRVLHKREFISIINIYKKVRWNKIIKGAGLWFFLMVIADLISYLIAPGDFIINFNPQNFVLLAIIALIAFPIQASLEELVFRGYIMQGIGLLFKKPFSVVIVSAICFAVLHWFNGSNLTMSASITGGAFIIGIMLGIITLADNGIELAVGIHIINNLYVSVIHSAPESGLGSLPSLIVSPMDPYTSPFSLIILSAVVIFVLFRHRKDDLRRVFY
ncbi:CPBP family intramembrane glutamic endopeptidase [Methanobacterium alcaliphilum]|uniref:CPBP family intramembrane glutamic endopeptidase n=1 Tax=Methanobacterium alcaliphilum TaxID=392018 RepID=UPI00200B8317|nr:type II CAAX endopeptidase family protein [Methanobacterium alcaliphilum]MCK9151514.1 CPBP family intramembrane metalloprotease [Methanobacterium alcaliphilum]